MFTVVRMGDGPPATRERPGVAGWRSGRARGVSSRCAGVGAAQADPPGAFRSRPQVAPSVRGAETDADLGVL